MRPRKEIEYGTSKATQKKGMLKGPPRSSLSFDGMHYLLGTDRKEE